MIFLIGTTAPLSLINQEEVVDWEKELI